MNQDSMHRRSLRILLLVALLASWPVTQRVSGAADAPPAQAAVPLHTLADDLRADDPTRHAAAIDALLAAHDVWAFDLLARHALDTNKLEPAQRSALAAALAGSHFAAHPPVADRFAQLWRGLVDDGERARPGVFYGRLNPTFAPRRSGLRWHTLSDVSRRMLAAHVDPTDRRVALAAAPLLGPPPPTAEPDDDELLDQLLALAGDAPVKPDAAQRTIALATPRIHRRPAFADRADAAVARITVALRERAAGHGWIASLKASPASFRAVGLFADLHDASAGRLTAARDAAEDLALALAASLAADRAQPGGAPVKAPDAAHRDRALASLLDELTVALRLATPRGHRRGADPTENIDADRLPPSARWFVLGVRAREGSFEARRIVAESSERLASAVIERAENLAQAPDAAARKPARAELARALRDLLAVKRSVPAELLRLGGDPAALDAAAANAGAMTLHAWSAAHRPPPRRVQPTDADKRRELADAIAAYRAAGDDPRNSFDDLLRLAARNDLLDEPALLVLYRADPTLHKRSIRRVEIAKLIASFGEPGDLGRLQRFWMDSRPDVREAAVHAAARQRMRPMLDWLLGMYDRQRHASMRALTARLLAADGLANADNLPFILDKLATETDPAALGFLAIALHRLVVSDASRNAAAVAIADTLRDESVGQRAFYLDAVARAALGDPDLALDAAADARTRIAQTDRVRVRLMRGR